MKRWLTLLVAALALTACAEQSQQSAPNTQLTVGAEQAERYLPQLADKNVALVVNQTSRAHDQHLVDYLLAQNIHVTKVLAPEHGFRGDAGAGETIDDAIDPSTGLPILSIYGKTKKPTAEMLADIDVIVFDIQDVGARFYTYISTMHYVMEAAAEQGIEMLVLDRPNPNGAFVDGPVLEKQFQSFVGMHEIPLLHGMTVGELAQMIKGEGWINEAPALDLTVVPVTNYRRDMAYDLPVAPSPNLPNAQAIQLYPSLCLFEPTAVSIGRGTDFPFQVLGHHQVALGDFQFSPRSMPNSAPNPKLEGESLQGRDLRNSQIQGFDLKPLLQAYQAFKAAGQADNFFTSPDFMDKLSGTDKLRKAIIAGESEAEIRASWQADLAQFKQQRQPYLLYPDND
ncbi:exo-beta-N-acetylmuramidase NamZ domain-containing protein [Pseudidiomarina aquimaris]|uniref:exo-beta-N-acetylmuramidase NamZ family protein n=1 Tax=Pseudidiomarina aquimaris TaxID=641841 RepID=UPI003A9715F1